MVYCGSGFGARRAFEQRETCNACARKFATSIRVIFSLARPEEEEVFLVCHLLTSLSEARLLLGQSGLQHLVQVMTKMKLHLVVRVSVDDTAARHKN